jgi:hypothetical protein
VAARISRSFLSGGAPNVPLGPRSRSAEVRARSLFFLTAIGIVGAASAGSLFAAAYVLLMQPTAVVHPPAPSAARAAPTPAPPSPAGVAAAASSPLVSPAPMPSATASPRLAAAPAPAGVAAKAPPPIIERTAPAPGAAELSHVAATPRQAADPRSVVAGFALAQGDADFAHGELPAARFFYERAFDAGDAGAAVRLGETFDPAFSTSGRLRRVRGDPAAARFWYSRALDLGGAEAKQRLDNLDAEPAAAAPSSGRARSSIFRNRAATRRQGDQPASPPNGALDQLLDRILHPSRGG